MRRAALILVTGTLMACGGSQDVCQRVLSLDQSESSKVQSCGGDDTSFAAEIAAYQNGGEQACEQSLKNCTTADLSAVNSELDCLQSLNATVQCKWFTETDASDDPTFQAYDSSLQDCQARAANVSAACGGQN